VWTIAKEGTMPGAQVPEGEQLSVAVELLRGVPVVRVAGELDVYTSPRLRATLEERVGDGPDGVVVDLTGLRFMDSSGLGVLIGAKKRVREPARFAVVANEGPVMRLLSITGLIEVLSVFDSLDTALQAVSSQSRPASE
jgi:anti-sigma B factor antagonist